MPSASDRRAWLAPRTPRSGGKPDTAYLQQSPPQRTPQLHGTNPPIGETHFADNRAVISFSRVYRVLSGSMSDAIAFPKSLKCIHPERECGAVGTNESILPGSESA